MRIAPSILIILLLVTGCQEIRVGMRMKRFTSHKVVFPESLIKVQGRDSNDVDLSIDVPRLVVYVDSSDCSSCRLNNLMYYTDYASLSKVFPVFQFFVIIFPDSESEDNIIKNISHRSFPFDVFVDLEGAFSKKNPFLPQRDSRYHCFLLDWDQHPSMVGDPSSSRRLDVLFNKTFNQIITKQ